MSRPATDRLKCNPALGTPPVLQFVTPAQLHIDPSYQRSLDTEASKALIRRIAQFWDWALCQPLNVARRADGKLYVIDGQHRLAAARLRRDIPHLPAVVLEYASIAYEAASFVHLNQQRRPLIKLDLFKAAVASGDSEATQIADAVREGGLTIAPHSNYTAWKPGYISHLGGIENAWRKHGPQITRLALRALAESYPGTVLRYAGTIWPGIVAVVAEEAAAFKPPFTPKSWAAFTHMIGSRPQEDWRAEILRARGDDPDLSWAEAAGKVFLDAWDGDEALESLVRGVEAAAAASPTPPNPHATHALAAGLMAAVSGRAKTPAQPTADAPPAKRAARAGRPVIPTGLFGIAKAAPSAPQSPVSAPQPIPARPPAGSVAGPRKFTPGADRKDFCFQCDRRVGASEMTNCKDRFCTFKRES